MEAIRRFMSEQQDESSTPEIATDSSLPTLYFPVSPLKLVVMSTCTFGLYELFWYFNNWYMIKEHDQIKISPMGRAFFAFFFCYPLFKRIRVTADSRQLRKPLTPGPLAAGWIIFTILARLPDPFWLFSVLSVLFLLPVQKTVNEINRVTDPGHNPNRTFTGWNIAGVVVGGLAWVLILIGTFLPTTPK